VLSFTERLYLYMRMQRKPIHVSVVMARPLATSIFTDAKGAGSADSHHRTVMKDMLADGMKPMEAAQILRPAAPAATSGCRHTRN